MNNSLEPLADRTVTLVDAYSRGAVLAEAFAPYAKCIHVTSRAEMPEIFVRTLRHDLFSDRIDAGILPASDLARRISAHAPAAIVAGSEFGVEMADALSEALSLPSNGTALSAARRATSA